MSEVAFMTDITASWKIA